MGVTHETEKQQILPPRVPFDFCSLSIRDQMNSKLLLLAVVDLDAVMMGDSRLLSDLQSFTVNVGWGSMSRRSTLWFSGSARRCPLQPVVRQIAS